MTKITKTFPFTLTVKNLHEEEDDKKQSIGIIKGYISTFGNVDRQDDIIAPNAFDDTLIALRASKKTFLPMLWQHEMRNPIGGFRISEMRTDERGLFVVGEVNLETSKGRDAFALLKQGVITDFSIGFFIKEQSQDGDIRTIEVVELVEASLVTIPANGEANVTEVDVKCAFHDLPIVASKSAAWDAGQALERLKDFTGSQDKPNGEFETAFLWCDATKSNDFGSYHLQIADVIDGKMQVVPNAVFLASGLLETIKGTGHMHDDQIDKIASNLGRYYKRMDMQSPFETAFGVFEIKAASAKTLGNMLKKQTKFSQAARDYLVGLEMGRRKGVETKGDFPELTALQSAINSYEKELSHGR